MAMTPEQLAVDRLRAHAKRVEVYHRATDARLELTPAALQRVEDYVADFAQESRHLPYGPHEDGELVYLFPFTPRPLSS